MVGQRRLWRNAEDAFRRSRDDHREADLTRGRSHEGLGFTERAARGALAFDGR
jgi:hypothetical protein